MSYVYTKPIGAYQYVPYISGYPFSVKKTIVLDEMTRRVRICNNIQALKISVIDSIQKLRNCKYPINCLRKETTK